MSSSMLNPREILDNLGGVLAKISSPESTLYWLYFLSAAGIALVIYWRSGQGTEHVSLKGFMAFCLPKRIYGHPSAKLDFKYFAINAVISGALFAPLLVSSELSARAVLATLIALFGVPVAPLLPGGWCSNLGVTVAVVLAADFAFFISHYVQHRVPFLWEFHKVHHAAEVLHPVTLYRAHPVDRGLDVIVMGGAAGSVLGLCGYVLGDSLEIITLLGANAVVFFFNVAGVHLRHSHLRLSYGPLLERILVSPRLHQIHHGCAPQHVDKNFGGILAIWDWLAGTLYVPCKDEEPVLGLANGEHREYDSILNLYLLPIRKNAKRLARLFERR